MARSRYPLQAARQVRAHAVEAASRELAEQQAARSGAEARAMAAERRLEEHQARTRELERQATEVSIPRSAGELVRAQCYLERRGEEAKALCTEVEAARSAAQEAARQVDRARARLARARAEAEAVERHREDWERDRQREDDAREEAEAEDIVLARRPRG